MSRIFIFDAERRDWTARRRNGSGNGAELPPVTRRYLFIIDEPRVREAVWNAFSTPPNAVHPHESGRDPFLYCIAGPSCRRPKKLIEALRHKLQKSALPDAELQGLEILLS